MKCRVCSGECDRGTVNRCTSCQVQNVLNKLGMQSMGLIPGSLVSAVAHCTQCGLFTELTDDGYCYKCSDLWVEQELLREVKR